MRARATVQDTNLRSRRRRGARGAGAEGADERAREHGGQSGWVGGWVGARVGVGRRGRRSRERGAVVQAPRRGPQRRAHLGTADTSTSVSESRPSDRRRGARAARYHIIARHLFSQPWGRCAACLCLRSVCGSRRALDLRSPAALFRGPPHLISWPRASPSICGSALPALSPPNSMYNTWTRSNSLFFYGLTALFLAAAASNVT